MENARTNITLKTVRSSRILKMAKIACCNHYACYDRAKQMILKAIKNGHSSVTMNVTLAENEYKKFCDLITSQALNVDIIEEDTTLKVVTKINVFADVND